MTSQNGAIYVNCVTLPLPDKPTGQPCGVSLDRLIWFEYGLTLVVLPEISSHLLDALIKICYRYLRLIGNERVILSPHRLYEVRIQITLASPSALAVLSVKY